MALTLIRRLFRKPQVNYVQLNVGGSQPLIYTKRRLARIMVDYQTGNSYIAEKFFDDSRNKRSPQVFFLNKFFFIFVCPWSPCSAACSILAIASCFSTWAFSSCRLRSVIKSDSTSSAISKFQSLNFKKFKCLSDRAMNRSLFLQI